MNKMNFRSVGRLLTVIAFFMLAFSCKKSVTDNPMSPIEPVPDAKAYVKVMNASPSNSPVKIYLGGEIVSEHFPLGMSTAYKPFLAGNPLIEIKDASGKVLLSQPVELLKNKTYSVFIIGKSSSTVPEEQTRIVIVQDDLIYGPLKAKFRLFNATPGSPSISLFINDVNLFSNIAYGKTSGFIEVPKGDNRFSVRTSLFEIASSIMPMKAGTFYTLIPYEIYNKADNNGSVSMWSVSP
jgi:hypothetical protein